jgi:hypothetical protein
MKNILWRLSVLAIAAQLVASTARANVYATLLKMDNAHDAVTAVGHGNVNITFILNEPATVGTTINISSVTNLIRTLVFGPGTNGTWRGTNLCVWDGNDSNGVAVPSAIYSFAITTAAVGYTNWTQISRDTDAGNYVYNPRGVAVDNITNSFFYGRVFVGSAQQKYSTNNNPIPGNNDTILKLNADSSIPGDGPSGNGGYQIYDDGSQDLPQKMRMGDDERLYMNDLTDYGEIVAFDPLLSTYEVVLNVANYVNNPFYPNMVNNQGGWLSLDVTGTPTTNGLVWLGDEDPSGAGIYYWHLITNGIVDPNDTTGTNAVPIGNSLTVAASGGLMVDANSNIFVGQYLTDQGDTNAGCMLFTNLPGNNIASALAWKATNLLGVYDTTIDSRQNPKYVACALNGAPATNGVRILNAKTGSTVASLDPTNQYYATAWDTAGNVYGVSETAHLLRIFSPPGTNQTTLTVLVHVEPIIASIIYKNANVIITFLAAASDVASQFSLVSAPVINGTFTDTLAPISLITNGTFTVTTPANGAVQFYKIKSSR